MTPFERIVLIICITVLLTLNIDDHFIGGIVIGAALALLLVDALIDFENDDMGDW